MDQKSIIEKKRFHPNFHARTKFYKIKLEDLQHYFDCNSFYFEDDDHSGNDGPLCRQYENQAIEFLYSLGAMLHVEQFLDIEGNGVVYVRELPPGMTPIHNP